MPTPDGSIEIQHASCDDSSTTIHVEGEAQAGRAACLVPRRYRKQPEWWVIEVVGVEAPTEQAQRFTLSCDATGMWGKQGIEIVGPATTLRIPKAGATDHPKKKLSSRARVVRSSPSDS